MYAIRYQSIVLAAYSVWLYDGLSLLFLNKIQKAGSESVLHLSIPWGNIFGVIESRIQLHCAASEASDDATTLSQKVKLRCHDMMFGPFRSKPGAEVSLVEKPVYLAIAQSFWLYILIHFIFFHQLDSWCSGYHFCLTPRLRPTSSTGGPRFETGRIHLLVFESNNLLVLCAGDPNRINRDVGVTGLMLGLTTSLTWWALPTRIKFCHSLSMIYPCIRNRCRSA